MPSNDDRLIKTKHATVIVIGAGVSGLAAAQTLRRCRDVIVLEARDRIGGRLHTSTTFPGEEGKEDGNTDFVVNFGATFLHGLEGNPIGKILQKNPKVKLTEVLWHEHGSVYDGNGREISPDLVEEKWDEYQTLLKRAQKYAWKAENGINMSLEHAMAQVDPESLNDPLINCFLGYDIQSDFGAPIGSIAAFWYDNDDEYGEDDHLVIGGGGLHSVVDALAKGVDIRTNVVVKTVRYMDEPGGVTITTANGETYSSDYVICTVPIGCLRSGDITFHPALPDDVQQAIGRIGIGNVVKVSLLFDEVFWRQDVSGFALASASKSHRGRFPFFMNIHFYYRKPVLEAFATGDYAEQIREQDDNTVIQDAMNAIQTMFPQSHQKKYDLPPVPQAPASFSVSRWMTDEYSKGAYSFASIHTDRHDFDEFREPIRNVLLFAGEHTSQKYRGSLHGAYLSGVHAASKVNDRERCSPNCGVL